MPDQSRLTVRADAYAAIGAGHVMRCLALAQAWRDSGGTVAFAGHFDSQGLIDRIVAECEEVVRLDRPHPSGDIDRLLDVAGARSRGPVVIDGYGFDPDYHRAVRRHGHPLLVVDDNAHLPSYETDWLLNQNVFATEAMYHGKVAARAQLLVGPRFALLRREFTRFRSWQRPPPEGARRVLVTLGGSDPGNVTLEVLRGLAAVGARGWVVRVIAGYSNVHAASLEDFAAFSGLACEILSGVDDMPEQMLWADIAISAAGGTSWELVYMQLPALLITVVDNQGANATELAARGVAVDLGSVDLGLPQRLAAAMAELDSNHDRKQDMSRRGRALVDGWGAGRVAAALKEGYPRS